MKKTTPLLIGFEGTILDQKLERHLNAVNPAGVVLFKRNFSSSRQGKKLVADLRGLLGDIIVAVDHEGGVVSRFPSDCPVPPSPLSLKEAGDPDLIREACALQAEVLQYMGINLNFAPVLDVHGHPGNQVIGTRAFSSDPSEIAGYGKICLEEHSRLNIGVTAKHFPGHGRTAEDSHFTSGTVEASADSLWNRDLLPFRRIIDLGVPAVMTAHLVFPALDARFPATFSRKILTGLLREKMNFNGLIITDCVEMKAVSEDFPPEDMIRLGVRAGADLWISAFGMAKSYSLQLALKQAFDKIAGESENANNIAASRKRLDYFLRTRSSSGDETKALKFQRSESGFLESRFKPALDIHRKTILKTKQSPIPEGYDKFYLLELSNRERSGINEDPPWSAVAEELVENYPSGMERKMIFQGDISQLEACAKLCDDNRRTLVLLTADGFRQKKYFEFVDGLKNTVSAVHIALLEQKDLSGVFPNEWATLGYNSFTGKALAEELARLAAGSQRPDARLPTAKFS